MKTTFSSLTKFFTFVCLTCTLLFVFAAPAHATPAQTLPELKIIFGAAGEVGTHETSPNFVNGKPYAQFHKEWCGDFVRWVVENAGITVSDHGRGAMNPLVARAWGYYGANGGGYGRIGKMHDARPGDILIDSYDNTPATGGHVSIVIETNIGGESNQVMAVGGNETGNKVNLSKKNLDTDSRYLVTLAELNHQTAFLTSGGAVLYDRYTTPFGAAIKITGFWTASGLATTPEQMKATGYRLRVTSAFTRQTEFFKPDQPILTEFFTHVQLTRWGWIPGADLEPPTQLTYN